MISYLYDPDAHTCMRAIIPIEGIMRFNFIQGLEFTHTHTHTRARAHMIWGTLPGYLPIFLNVISDLVLNSDKC